MRRCRMPCFEPEPVSRTKELPNVGTVSTTVSLNPMYQVYLAPWGVVLIKSVLFASNWLLGELCVFFELNRVFYPLTSSTPSVRADSPSYQREVQALW